MLGLPPNSPDLLETELEISQEANETNSGTSSCIHASVTMEIQGCDCLTCVTGQLKPVWPQFSMHGHFTDCG